MAAKEKFIKTLYKIVKKMANKISNLLSTSSTIDENKLNKLETNTVDIMTEPKDTKNSAASTANHAAQPADKTITPAYNKRLSEDTGFIIQDIREIMVSPVTKKKKKKPTKP